MWARVFAAAVLAASLPAAAVQLTPVLASGLTNPVFVTHAHDGSNRLFIVEKAGIIKVLQPGSSTPTVFLDIHTKVVDGSPPNEQGLLGLAFHPLYPANPRFFVFYTRVGDGALLIAEYQVSGDPNVASTTEKPILPIPHPGHSNHNGGMLAFSPEGYLLIGTGDGGGTNDPNNNGQNVNSLLGKLLRIDVDSPNGDVPYSSPASNPFFGATAGADEIFSYGLRNPWRFSLDRANGQVWLGDVGQFQREEVDTPMVSGGNYGWRVKEGTRCNTDVPGVDAGVCAALSSIAPTIEYAHGGGRCSVTGGYVYRGTADTQPQGTYLYGDYCTGEIFVWNGTPASLLLDTSVFLSSFGEDEAGEMLVVGVGGSVSRLTNGCAYSVTPSSKFLSTEGGGGSIEVTAAGGCAWRAVSNSPFVSVTSGSTGSGAGTVTYTVAAAPGGDLRVGTISVAGKLFVVRQRAATVVDVFSLINHLFAGAALPAGFTDVNGDGIVSVLDVFHLINYLFAAGPPPA
jgi:hypothetical protein